MPSLAQRYGQGLLSGLEIQERQRRLRQADLLDEYRKEQIADIRWEREKEKKGLLAQIKEEEKQEEAQQIRTGVAHLGMQPGGEYTVGKLLEEAPETVREPLYSALDLVPGLTSGQQLQRTRVEKKVEGAPGTIPFLGQYLPEEMRPEAAEMAYGFKPKVGAGRVTPSWQADRALFSKTPSEMTVEEYRIALSKGREWDPEKGAWIPTRVGFNLFGGLLEGGGAPSPETAGRGEETEVDPTLINYINDEATDRAEAEGFLYDMGHTNPKDISRILAKTKFGK